MWPFQRRQPSLQQRLRQANEALRKHDLPAAIKAYQQILEQDPGNVGVVLNLGAALHLAGQHTPAIERFEEALQHEPHNVTALINLSAAHGSLGHLDKGIAALVRALELDSTKRDLHYNLAVLYLRKGELANAMAELELELAMHPDHALASSTLLQLRRQHLG